MKKYLLLCTILSCFFLSCKKTTDTDLTDKGFIVIQVASCNNGTPSITNLSNGELYITFNSSTFKPAPNTWYKASNPGSPCGSCSALFRFKTGSDVNPKDADVTSDADPIALTQSNICN